MSIKAYSYVRFSTLDQMKGDSLRRQKQLSEDYAKKHNLLLDNSIKMHDLGISAFKGDNSESGALGAFLRAVEDGKIETGSYLLVENLDRISREEVKIALELFLSILRSGIVIVTLNDGMKYHYDTLDMNQLIMSITIMFRAHNESQIKSERVSKAWENKINNASIKPVTKWLPTWLYLSEGKINVVPERVELIQEIYQWVCSGLGTTLILKRLNEMDIEPWGQPINVKENRIPKRWYASYVQRILTNRAVLGEYQPRKGKEGNTEVIKDYYPQIIDEQMFYRVQAIRKSRDVRAGKGIGRRGDYVSNLFSGLLKCGYSQENNLSNYKCSGDDSSITITSKGRKSKVRYLQCSRIRDGGTGCDACRKLWRYDHFESSFLKYANEIDIGILLGEDDSDKNKILQIKNNLLTLSGKENRLKQEMQNIIAAFGNNQKVPHFLIERSRNIDGELKDVQTQIEHAQSELKATEAGYQNKAIKYDEFKQLLLEIQKQDTVKGKELRLKFSELLRLSIDRVDVYVKGLVQNNELKQILKEIYADNKNRVSKFESFHSEKSPSFFTVHYKSGHKRFVIADPNDSDQLWATAKWGDGSDLEGFLVSLTKMNKY